MAFYPIFLILITFLCIKFHDNNFRPIVRLWKPFHRHFVHLRRRWDSKASIINVFTTFLFLAFSKIGVFVTCYTPSTFSIEHHGIQKKCILYYDPTVKCHTQEHFIFAAIAVCVLVMFILTPTISLLILYPTRLFGRCASCCRFGDGILCTCLWNHFRGSTRMEPMVLVTSGWFLQHSLSLEY